VQSFNWAAVEVVDVMNAPVDGLSTLTTFLPTGQVVRVTSYYALPPGHYIVADDGEGRSLTDEDGELFRFEIASTPVPVTREFLIGTTACHCHIQSGLLARIVLEP
jgi:hypothetical protein